MSNRADEIRREKIGLRFIAALDDGDLETLASLWEEAGTDAELGRLFCELSDAVYDDEVGRPGPVGDTFKSPAAHDVPAHGPSQGCPGACDGPDWNLHSRRIQDLHDQFYKSGDPAEQKKLLTEIYMAMALLLTLCPIYHAQARKQLGKFPGREEMAHDATQDALTHHMAALKRGIPVGKWEPYFSKIHRNRIVDRIRAHRRDRVGSGIDQTAVVGDSSGDAPSVSLEVKELLGHVTEAIAGLPALYRDVVILHYFDGLEYKSIAERLGIPIGTVKSRMNRAKELLRELLEEFGPGP